MDISQNEPKEMEPPKSKEDHTQNAGNPNIRKEVTVFKGDKDKPSQAEKWLIAISIILAICNVLIIIYASNQSQAAIDAVKLGRDQFKYQREQDSISAISQRKKDSIFAKSQFSRDSLNFVSALLAEKMNKIDLRAYINTIDIVFDKIVIGEKIRLRLNVKNFGKTPAYRVRAGVAGKIGGTGVYGFEIQKIDKSNDEITLASNEVLKNSIEINNKFWTKDDSIKVFTGQKNCFVFGIITYRDIFKDIHRTNFCFVYTARLKRFTAYKQFNEAD